PLEPTAWTKDEKSILIEAISELTFSLRRPSSFDIEKHHKQKRYLMTLFWDDNSNITKYTGQYPTYFPPELIILYELLSIYKALCRMWWCFSTHSFLVIRGQAKATDLIACLY